MDNSGVATPALALRRLLIVDDQKSVLSTLRVLFESRGHSVLLAESGPAALALLQQNTVDVALIDLHMPGMDGLHVCRQVLADAAQQGRPLKVWMMTAAFTNASARNCVEAGAAALLKKPFDWQALAQEFEMIDVIPQATAPRPAADPLTNAA